MIQTVILDFGGIIIDLDQSGCYRRIKDLFRVPQDEKVPDDIQSILDQYEIGAFSEGSFMHRLQRLRPYVITERAIQDTWNSMLIGIPRHRLEWLLKLKEKFQLLLLSNTNHTHIKWVHQYLKSEYDIADFESTFFHHVIYSHEIHLSKPSVDTYNFAAKQYRLNLEKTIFIDDTPANVEGARSAGWKAARHDPNKEIMNKLESYLTQLG